jgi:hypothetical protein
MGITHAFVSGIEDGTNEELVRPSDWNATHEGLITVRKNTNETVNNSNSLQNDNELLFAIGANEIWEFQIFLQAQVDADNDFKFDVTVPSGSIVFTNQQPTALVNWSTSAISMATGTDRANAIVFIYGIAMNGATPGNVQLRWAQNTASAIDTIVKANSCLIAHKLG